MPAGSRQERHPLTRKIVVGYDGSERAKDALHLARLLAEPTGASLVVANVFRYMPLGADPMVTVIGPVDWDERTELQARRAEALATEALACVPARIPTEIRAIADSSAARGLRDLARQEQADMIVLGSTHRGPVGRVVPGSVAERLLHGERPLTVAPRDFRRRAEGASDGAIRAIRVVGVAFDGSAEAEAALRSAAELTRACGAVLLLLTVVEPPQLGYASVDSYLSGHVADFERHYAWQRLNAVLETLPSELQAEARLLPGRAVPAELGAAATREGIDLLVVGSRGHGLARRALLGGVSARLLRSAPCPVLVVPRRASVRAPTERAAEVSAA